MFGKRPSELTPDDIQRAIDEQVQEGSQVEFKEQLPAKKGDDPWLTGRGRVGDYARNQMVEEVIAFANAHGGWLLLGVQETSSKPARAKAIYPIRDCAELAERLRLHCRDCIEPQLPILEVAGVPMDDSGAGVVVFHVPHSRMAPHRHTATKECYVRRADRTEKMTMREIQDLTLQLDRGLAAIERRFEERQELFARIWKSFIANADKAFGMRATVVPLAPLYIERVHGNDTVRPPTLTFYTSENSGTPFEIPFPIHGGAWRPVIRGTICEDAYGTYDHRRTVFCDGLIEYSMLDRQEGESPLWMFPSGVMAVAANAFLAAERFRRAARGPDVEYGLEIEFRIRGAEVLVASYGSGPPMRPLGKLLSERTIFPRYPIGPREEFETVWRWFERDFWHAAGTDWQDESISVDFSRAFRELGLTTIDEEQDQE